MVSEQLSDHALSDVIELGSSSAIARVRMSGPRVFRQCIQPAISSKGDGLRSHGPVRGIGARAFAVVGALRVRNFVAARTTTM